LSVAEAELALRQEALDQYVAQNPEAAEAPSNGTPSLDYSALVNRVERQRGVVEELQGALQTTERMLASAPQGQEAALSVQDAAPPSRAPLPTGLPPRLGLPAAGLGLGLLIAGGYVLVRYRIDHTIRSSEDMEEFRAPVLGTSAELRPSGLLWWLDARLLVNR